MLRGSGPRRATRCGGQLSVHEPVTARDEVGVPITAIEVSPVPITAGDVATVPVTARAEASVPVTAGDVVRRAPAERTLPEAEREGKARACYAWWLVCAREGQGWNAGGIEGLNLI